MNNIKVSLDYQGFTAKPINEIIDISTRIAEQPILLKSSNDIYEFVRKVSTKGHTFCPATFKNGKRNKDNFEQQQLFALDFDNKTPENQISFEEFKARTEKYDLPMLFAYETFSSKKKDKFRAVFLNDVSITYQRVAKATSIVLGTIFPEADPSCYKDVSKMYFGGKRLIYYDDNLPKIDIESLFINLEDYLRQKYGSKHFKEKIFKFSQEAGIGLTKKGFLDVFSTFDHPTEDVGASQSLQNQNGGISPKPIIYNSYIIIVNGEFPPKFYFINITGENCINDHSVANRAIQDRFFKNHKSYRWEDLNEIDQRCKLFLEFTSGKVKLNHNELVMIASNLLNVESGSKKFMDVLLKYPHFYDDYKLKKAKKYLDYFPQHDYKPYGCNTYCQRRM
jgi:hypothetical protein